MSGTAEPMIKLDPGGKAPILSYNIPEPTSYTGINYLELDYPASYFKPSTYKKSTNMRASFKNLDRSTLKDKITSAMKVGFFDPELFPYLKLSPAAISLVEKTNPGMALMSVEPITGTLSNLTPEIIATHIQAGDNLTLYRTMHGELNAKFFKPANVSSPRLLLAETYRLSSYLGNYGAGRIIKTFSLLPGEKTKISVKTYAKREEDAKSASSIFDSFSEESAKDFENSLESEQSNKEKYEETFAYHAEAEASCSWGFGSAKVSGGVKGGTDSAREESARNISKATEKHAAKASAKRDVQINTSFEVKEQTEEETSIEREIQNINVSRTLNFVFRQMNQEFITILYLVDVRIAFFDGSNYREVPMHELDSLLEDVIVDQAKRDEVRGDIVDELSNVYNYEDKVQPFIEEKVIQIKDKNGNVIQPYSYLRVRKDLTSAYIPDPDKEGLKIVVTGIILSAKKHVLRTDGVIVDALLGQGDGLDQYSHGLQDETVKAKVLTNELLREQIKREKLGQEIVETKDEAASKIYQMVFPVADDEATQKVYQQFLSPSEVNKEQEEKVDGL
jgi:hypothetical protein